MKPLCRSETVPVDFDEQLARYTRTGLRVLALGARRLGAINIDQVCTCFCAIDLCQVPVLIFVPILYHPGTSAETK